jgi:hypothetical protein
LSTNLIDAFNLGFGCIIGLLIYVTICDESAQHFLGGWKGDGLWLAPAVADHFPLHVLSILEFLVLLLHEILQIVIHQLVDSLVLASDGLSELIFVFVIVS